MKTKAYKCSICDTTFEFTKNTKPLELREIITRHCFKHFTEGEEAFVTATNYRANYTCVTCGKVFNVGANGLDAMMARIAEHRKVCACATVVPAEFVSQAEEDSWPVIVED